MARKTDGEKIEDLQRDVKELERIVALIFQRAASTGAAVADVERTCRDIVRGHNDLRRESEKEVVGFKKEIEELRRWMEKNGTSDLKAEVAGVKERTAKVESAQDRMGNRAWSVVPNVVGAVVNVLLAAGVALLVSRAAK